MSGLYGITQAYNGLTDTYLALAPSCGDKLFDTNINYCDLVNWGIYDGQEQVPNVLDMYKQQGTTCSDGLCGTSQTDYDSVSTDGTTIWSVLKRLPNASKWRQFVVRTGLDAMCQLQNGITQNTLFVPVDEVIPDSWMKKITTVPGNALRPLVQAHMLPFAFDQEQAKARKLRLYTSLDTFSVYIDGTGEVTSGYSFYVPSTQMKNFRYPQPLQRINIKQGYFTQNGAIYLIDGMFAPPIVLP